MVEAVVVMVYEEAKEVAYGRPIFHDWCGAGGIGDKRSEQKGRRTKQVYLIKETEDASRVSVHGCRHVWGSVKSIFQYIVKTQLLN